MKKHLICFIFGTFSWISTMYFVSADTTTITWLNEDISVYDTTTCNLGDDVILPYAPTKRGHTFLGWVPYITPVEYLNTNSGAMINTGIIPTSTGNLYIRIKFRFKSFLSSSSVNGIWGYMNNRSGATSPRFGLYYFASDHVLGCGVNASLYFTGMTVALNQVYEVVFENGTTSVENQSKNEGVKSTSNTAMPIYFGARGNHLGEATWPSNIDIFEFEITYNDVHKYFIPALDVNNTPCMYDKIGKNCYYNVGKRDFVAGPALQ